MVRIRIELGGNGHKPPGQRSPGQKTPGQKPPGQKTIGEKVPNGDIFYCSGSRQLNHSSWQCCLSCRPISSKCTVIPYWIFTYLRFPSLRSRTLIFCTCIFHPYTFCHLVLHFSIIAFSSTSNFSAPPLDHPLPHWHRYRVGQCCV